jgi:LacI family transcriptional regulator
MGAPFDRLLPIAYFLELRRLISEHCLRFFLETIQPARLLFSSPPNFLTMRVTIRSVAKMAGVAPSTVSHYLNRTAPVSQTTAENVESAINKLNYRVNHGARSLRLQKTHSIGLVIPNISTPFFSEIATSIEDKLWEQDFQTLLCISERNIEREYLQCANLASRQVDGILLAYNSEQSRLTEIAQNLNVPVVFIDRPVPGRN